MSVFRRLFGPERNAPLCRVIEEAGGEILDRGSWTRSEVVAKVRGWTAWFGTDRHDDVRTSSIRVPHVPAAGLRFSLSPRLPFSGLAKLLGRKDITTGDPAFDERFVLRGSDDERVLALFGDERLRRLIREERELMLVLHDGHWSGKELLPDGEPHPVVEELELRVPGKLTDVARTRNLFDILETTLQRLADTGLPR